MSYIDADVALTLINQELLAAGCAPVVMTDQQRRQAFISLQQYAQFTGRSLDLAIKDLARYQIQTLELEALRRQS